MTELVVRRLLIDLESPLPRHWCGGDPFRTALFNALSMSFPVGEQFFIDSVRDGLRTLPPDAQARHAREVQGFVGQEATHRRLHGLFNQHLDAQGLRNDWGPRAQRNMQALAGTDPRHALAITAANEHFTAILAEWLLGHDDILEGSEPRLRLLWQWHSAEESEHKCVAFDLYQALGGDTRWRLRWFRRITLIFLYEMLRQTLLNLRRDGTLWRWATWRSATRWLLGRHGLIRANFGAWKDYLRADFHPAQQHSDRARRWLGAHADVAVPVNAARAAA